jgi:hypothetical protein
MDPAEQIMWDLFVTKKIMWELYKFSWTLKIILVYFMINLCLLLQNQKQK